jgi:cell wall-associated NlpC family hydrolase
MNTPKQSVVYVPVFSEVCDSVLRRLEWALVSVKYTLPLILSILFLTGCSSTPSYVSHSSKSIPLASPVDLTNLSKVKSRLLRQYKEWKGTPYRYGGTSRKGVDCSAFVQNSFYSQLGYKLPRTTRTQIKAGSKIAKSDLKVGDIVFFNTGSNSLHNGIYIGESEFIHASSSKGVTISNLDNQYWQKTYLTSIRIR